MVVGFGKYQNTKEAYPLDKKTLQKVALRSLIAPLGNNAETGDSVGWCWALTPALKKIHENDEDLSLSMGHNLEFVDAGYFMNTFAMGVTLALEVQKADLTVIRSARTAAASLSKGIGRGIFVYLLIPVLALAFNTVLMNGSWAFAAVFALIVFVLSLIARFALIRVGYRYGTRAVEKLSAQSDRLIKACRYMGLFMVGALIVSCGYMFVQEPIGQLYSYTASDSSYTFSVFTYANRIIPALVSVLTTWLCFHGMKKKNWSIAKCVVVILLIAFAGAFFHIWPGVYECPVAWPWVS